MADLTQELQSQIKLKMQSGLNKFKQAQVLQELTQAASVVVFSLISAKRAAAASRQQFKISKYPQKRQILLFNPKEHIILALILYKPGPTLYLEEIISWQILKRQLLANMIPI